MKRLTIQVALAAALVPVAFAEIAALRPIVADGQSAVDAGLTGVWLEAEGDGMATITQQGVGYSITWSETKFVIHFQGRLLKTANATILDLTVDRELPSAIAVHLLLRVWIEGAELRFALLDTDWLRQRAREELAFTEINGTLVITASSDGLARFLVAHAGDDRAHNHAETLVRSGSS
jgi:hypothetical protein